jgi:hypothetical protein
VTVSWLLADMMRLETVMSWPLTETVPLEAVV